MLEREIRQLTTAYVEDRKPHWAEESLPKKQLKEALDQTKQLQKKLTEEQNRLKEANMKIKQLEDRLIVEQKRVKNAEEGVGLKVSADADVKIARLQEKLRNGRHTSFIAVFLYANV